MEMLVLKALDFNLLAPTVHTFLLRYLKAAEAEQLCQAKPTTHDSRVFEQRECVVDKLVTKQSSALSMVSGLIVSRS